MASKKEKKTGKSKGAVRKYGEDILIPMFLQAAVLRNKMLKAGFTDNGGAIHSAERILDILGLCLNYPQISHRNSLKTFDGAECSLAAFDAIKRRKPVQIEHVAPHRALTQKAIMISKPGHPGDAQRLRAFVKRNYRLVLLTPEERSLLDRNNRSRIHPDRLKMVGIKLSKRRASRQP